MSLEPLLAHLAPLGPTPPLERWDPPLSGDMDLTIDAEGHWIHEGAPIRRAPLVRLLASVLRREADGHYYLVSPEEKWRIRVVDRPLLIVDADRDEGGDWWLITQVGERVRLDGDHLLSLSRTPDGARVPELALRHGLSGRLNRPLFYRLVEAAEHRRQGETLALGLTSGGHWHPLGYLDADGNEVACD
ncbi:DUF1285 domain-containing protein [Halomonas pacifica]|uniref:DUF1285 domain-containing protein n=1 Tax=Bisbaumannia pacifica TaxID=77098 RepID=A0ABD4L5K0_9GAMM|nr:DUF1285 domain-containing protein [Halomonas pacifica]MBH8580867.1 DUF1285 domain-containing protein [Halomonas pacifica]MDC8804296.1 DUF1285 domain-containing protein [Halomonas pacifica]